MATYKELVIWLAFLILAVVEQGSGAAALDLSGAWDALMNPPISGGGTSSAVGGLFERFVKMETQMTIPNEFKMHAWTSTGKARDHEWHEVTFAIKQNNIEYLKDRIAQTSDLDSPMYGQHLSHEEVGKLVQNKEATKAVTEWLESNGVVAASTHYGEYIYAGATVGVWRELLKAKFHRYEPMDPDKKGGFVLRAREYSLPERIAKHVDTVLKATHLPTP